MNNGNSLRIFNYPLWPPRRSWHLCLILLSFTWGLPAKVLKQWPNPFGGDGAEVIHRIQQIYDGVFIMGGSSTPSMSGDKPESNRGARDNWMIKIDSNGNKIWDKTYGEDQDGLLQSMQTTRDGSYISGGFSDSVISGENSELSGNSLDNWIIKFTDLGNIDSERTYGGNQHDQATALIQASENSYLVAEFSESGSTGDKTDPNYGLLATSLPNYWVIELDPAGNLSGTGEVFQVLSGHHYCDSVFVLHHTLNANDTTYLIRTSCNPSDTGTTFQQYYNRFSCDSTVILQTILLPADTTYLVKSTCNPLDTGTTFELYTNQYNCDSLVVNHTLFTPTDTTILTRYTCNPQDTGITYQKTTDDLHCDSLLIIHTMLHPSDTTYLNYTSCNPTDTGSILQILTNQYGCDSLVVRRITFTPSDTVRIIQYTCNPLDSGLTVRTLRNRFDCDSLVLLQTLFQKVDTTILRYSSCHPIDTGMTIRILTNQHGCDSVLLINTVLSNSDTTLVTQFSCNPLDTGITFEYMTNRFNCDSLIIIQTSLAYPDTSYLYEESCKIAETGQFISKATNRFGCDSIIIRTVELSQLDTIFRNQLTCNALDTGIHFTTVVDPSGCDWIDGWRVRLKNIEPTIIEKQTCLPEETGRDTIKLTTAEGCDSTVVVLTSNQPFLTQINTRGVRCFGETTGMIHVTGVKKGIAPYLYSLNGAPLQDDPFFSFIPAGDYQLKIQDAEGCEQLELITIHSPDSLALELGPDSMIHWGQYIQLKPTTTGVFDKFYWESSDPVPCGSCLQPLVRPLRSSTYTLTIEDHRGCKAKDDIRIMVDLKHPIFIPNAFSPNGDGINDHFNVFGNAALEHIRMLRIFDRWGQLLYEGLDLPANDDQAGWNGYSGGQPLPSAVYTYYVEIEFADGSIEIHKGDVTIVR